MLWVMGGLLVGLALGYYAVRRGGSVVKTVEPSEALKLAMLQNSEERYRQLFDSALEGIYETFQNGKFRNANPAMAQIFGYESPADLTAFSGAQVQALYVNAGRRQEFYAAINRDGHLRNFQSQVQRNDGAIAWISEVVRMGRDDGTGEVYYQGFVTDITDRKRAESDLRESEERWRLAVEGSAAGVWESNLLTRKAFYSDRSKEMLGFLPDDVFNESREWTSRIHPDDQRLGVQAMRDHLEDRKPYYEVEHRLQCKDGSYRWILSRGRKMLDEQGQATRILGTHLDVSDRRRSEEKIRMSEQRFRTLFESSPFGIVEFDFRDEVAWLDQQRLGGLTDLHAFLSKGTGGLDEVLKVMRLTQINAAGLALVGARSAHEITENLHRFANQGVLKAKFELLVAIWNGQYEYEAEITLRAFDGSLRRLHTLWRVPLVEDRPMFDQTQLVLVDLTRLKSTEVALEQERERLRVTLGAMAEAVVTVSRDRRIQFLNMAAADLLGWKESDALGESIESLGALQDGVSKSLVPWPAEATMDGDRLVDLRLRTVLVRRDERHFLVDGRCAPMHDQEGRVVGAVLVMRDISERARLEDELQRASRIESVGLLAGGIAHDFNNILAVIMGNLTLALMDDDVKKGRIVRWLSEAEKAATRARDLTQQLLTFSKGGEPVRTLVSLSDLVREAAAFALHGASARCEFSIAEQAWAAEIDRVQIGQVVQNLVLNAVQSMPQGGVIRIAVENKVVNASARLPLAEGRYLRLDVTDQGTGIEAADVERIFEPYYTTKSSGSGLGLTTVFSIVRKHHGHISVVSTKGQGATFSVWLPASMELAPPVDARSTPFASLSGRVLFMDDEESIRMMAAALLTRLGMEPVTAEDGEEAVTLYREAQEKGTPFALVVMDLTVPGGMGGRQAMEEILKIDPQVRAIVSSGYSGDPVMANPRAYGFRGVVAKPYRITSLAKTLREVLAEENPA